MNYLGKFYPGNSFWHNSDPRSKLVVVKVILLSLLVLQGKWLIIPLVAISGLYLTSRIPQKLVWQVLHRFKWLLLITGVANLLRVDWANGLSGGLIVVESVTKLSISILVAVWLSFVTKPLVLVDGLMKCLQPLKLFKLPASDFALAVGLVIRFIPELWEHAEQVVTAQRLRGAPSGRVWQKNQLWIKSTLIPVFIATIRKSAALALALEARGYRSGQTRTPWIELRYGIQDWLITVGAVSYLGGVYCLYLI